MEEGIWGGGLRSARSIWSRQKHSRVSWVMSKVKIRNLPLLSLHPFASGFDSLFSESPATLAPVGLLRLPAPCRQGRTSHAAEEKSRQQLLGMQSSQ